jgi:hypothetical protein
MKALLAPEIHAQLAGNTESGTGGFKRVCQLHVVCRNGSLALEHESGE